MVYPVPARNGASDAGSPRVRCSHSDGLEGYIVSIFRYQGIIHDQSRWIKRYVFVQLLTGCE
jgi:hypothetical protein